MLSLITAALIFVGIHVFVSGTGLRDRFVAAVGEQPYRGMFSLATIGALAWMIGAYRNAPTILVWNGVPGARWLVLLLMLPAVLLVVIGLTTPNPTAVGAESRLERENAASGILRITRHPFLCGVALWSGLHLLVNGDAASMVLFGSLMVLSLVGPRSIDAKRKKAWGARWDRFASVTSHLPFAAIAANRNTLRLGEIGTWRFASGLVVYIVILVTHRRLFGVSPFP
jgi:uncharacterized membrane protein